MSGKNNLSGGARNLSDDEHFAERVRYYKEFLDADYGENEYKDKIRKMIAAKERRLVVNINHLRTYGRDYADGILESPMDYLPPFDTALKEIALSLLDNSKGVIEEDNYHIGLEGSFGDHKVSPRNISSVHLGKTISIEGIITRCSLVRPKVAKSVHYCDKTGAFHMQEYQDGTSLGSAIPSGSTYPKEDTDGNPLTTEFGWSSYRDYQTVSLQEMPERAPAGQLPRPLDVILDDDLADRVKPGDRVQIVGVYRSMGKHAASVSATFRTMILANNVHQLSKEIQQPSITDVDIQNIKKIGARENVFNLLATSLAPSIYGHDYIKRAILLLLLGGMEKNLANGTHLRGDINMLLIGDPSTAKSQMLRFVLNIAPLAIATTGRGSSGVGLTAAVTTDKETGERKLEAGAMVLADRGVVCIDEFDKMNDIDRVAIHEVMEQQTVTIAKAGIHTSLNARCSVLAAANPAYGHYLVDKPPHENILLPDSLLSRFDLVFVVLDTTDDELNRMISEHVLRVHRYVPPGLEEGAPINDAMLYGTENAGDEEDHQSTDVFQKYNKLLHVGIQAETTGRRRKTPKKVELLSIGFVKKYLHYAKRMVKPVLTQEAADFICQEYADLRAAKEGEGDQFRTMPITPRTLETLIRLSTAHAKARLSQQVEREDAELAVEILKFALYKEVKSKKRNKKPRVQAEESDESSDESDSEILPARSSATRKGKKNATQSTQSTTEEATSQLESMHLDSGVTLANSDVLPTSEISSSQDQIGNLIVGSSQLGSESQSSADARPLDPARLQQFKQGLHTIRTAAEQSGGSDDGIMVHDIISGLNDRLPGSQQFSVGEVKQALRAMSENNTVWYQEDTETVLFI